MHLLINVACAGEHDQRQLRYDLVVVAFHQPGHVLAGPPREARLCALMCVVGLNY
jgi:hypothetical protein